MRSLNAAVMSAVNAVRGACCCKECGTELLHIDGAGDVCGNLACPGCPIPVAPSPAAVRAGELRAAGYAPADHRNPYPEIRNAPAPERPSTDARAIAAQRARDAAYDEWLLCRGLILRLEAEAARDAGRRT